MAGWLTTHVLDTARGKPAAGMKVDLWKIEGETRRHVRMMVTNKDGRTDRPILPESEFEPGLYELSFHVGDWARNGDTFFDLLPIRFMMTEPTHYHVPLLVSPYGYSTYRGS